MEDDLRVNVGLDTTGFNQGVASMKRGFASFSDAMSSSMIRAARGVHEAESMFNRLDLAQITTQQSLDSLHRAQERYNDAVANFGESSDQARKAADELKHAHEQLDKAQMRSEMSAGLVAIQSMQLAAKIPTAVTALTALTAAEWNATTAAAAFESTITLGVGAVSIIAGIAAVTAAMHGYSETAFDAAGTTANLATLNRDYAAAMGEATKAKRLYDQTVAQGSDDIVRAMAQRSLDDAERKVTDTRAALITAQLAAQDSASSFLFAEDQKARVAAKDEYTIREQLKGTAQIMEENRKRLSHVPEGATEAQIAGWKKAYAEAESYSVNLKSTLADIESSRTKAAEDARLAVENQAKGLRDSLSMGLADYGVHLAALSAQTLGSLSALEGPMGTLAAQVAAVQKQEDGLVAAALRSSEALRNQATITRKKGETTDDFKARLLSMGFAEEQITGIVTDATKAFSLQTDAMAEGAAAMSGGSSGSRGGPQMDPLAAFLEANKVSLLSGTLGLNPNSEIFKHRLQAFDPDKVAKWLEGTLDMGQEGNARAMTDTGLLGRKDAFSKAAQNLLMGLPANQWDSILSLLGVKGMDVGNLNLSRNYAAGPSGNTVVVQQGAIVVKGQQADELLRSLQRIGVRA